MGVIASDGTAKPPYTARIFMVDGESNGTRIANIYMSSVKAVAFKRHQLKRIRKLGRNSDYFPRLELPGVYLLIGRDTDTLGRFPAYIGESESIWSRLYQHNSGKLGSDKSQKDWTWTDTVVLVSQDKSVTKGHARYVESRLIGAGRNNPRWAIKNTSLPGEDAGMLSVPDQAEMDRFVDQSKILVGALGWDLFRERGEGASLPLKGSPIFYLKSARCDAKMVIDQAGDFVVKAGSRGRVGTSKSIPDTYKPIRKKLFDEGILRREGDFCIFTSDCTFSSVTTAGVIVRGSNLSGPNFWKLADGQTYAQWVAAQTPAD